jgi:hypothetical protein
METTPQDLCKGLPLEFVKIHEYLINMELHQDPDYILIESLFKNAAESQDIELDMIFDW